MEKIQRYIKKYSKKILTQYPLLKRVIMYARVHAKKLSLEQFLFIVALLFSVFFIVGLYT